MAHTYTLRNLSHVGKEFAIFGIMQNSEDEQDVSVGVLEWCYDREDAENVLRDMKLDPRFLDLEIVPLDQL